MLVSLVGHTSKSKHMIMKDLLSDCLMFLIWSEESLPNSIIAYRDVQCAKEKLQMTAKHIKSIGINIKQ